MVVVAALGGGCSAGVQSTEPSAGSCRTADRCKHACQVAKLLLSSQMVAPVNKQTEKSPVASHTE